MSNGLDTNGNFIFGLKRNDIITNADIDALYNFYNTRITSLVPPTDNSIILNSMFTDIINNIEYFVEQNTDYYVDDNILNTLKSRINDNTIGGIIGNNYVFPKIKIHTANKTFTILETVTFTVPEGTTSMIVNLLLAGGGGAYGGSGKSPPGFWWAAGAGSGGYYQDRQITLSEGQTVTIAIGAGGKGTRTDNHEWIQYPNTSAAGDATNGEDSNVSINGSIVLNATGGGASNKITAGGGGTPLGNSGQPGGNGRANKEHSGAAGADSIIGSDTGGIGGDMTWTNIRNDARGYGAGGGGGGYSNHEGALTPGGNGGAGQAIINLTVPVSWSI